MSGTVSRPTVLVTDASRGSSLAIIRSLGRRGWRVIAADSEPGSPGFRSRHVHARWIHPAPTTDPVGLVRSLRDAVERWRVDLLIPVTDAVILPLSEARDALPGTCRVAMPDPEPLNVVIDKLRTLELAARLGIPVPRGVVVDSTEPAHQSVSELGWPVVLKPRASRVYRDRKSVEAFEVSYARDPDDLRVRLRHFAGRVDVLVQEYCAGEGHGIGLLMHEGRPLAAFQHRRLHEVPPTGGPSALREGVPLDRTLYEHSIRLLGALRWTGLAMVEFKVGPSSSRLMEVNGRVWGSLPLAVLSGVDFPSRLAELYRSGPPAAGVEPQLTYRVGVRARNLGLELNWIATALSGRGRYPYLAVPGRREGFAGLAGLFDPRCRLDTFELDDPGPWLAELPLFLRKLTDRRRSKGTGTQASMPLA